MKINFFNLIIEILTILSIIFALAVITSTNPVIAIIFLIVLFLNVAIYLILMGLNFIGLSYLLVYIGAITVLILFIVMMISTEVVQTVYHGSHVAKNVEIAEMYYIVFEVPGVLRRRAVMRPGRGDCALSTRLACKLEPQPQQP